MVLQKPVLSGLDLLLSPKRKLSRFSSPRISLDVDLRGGGRGGLKSYKQSSVNSGVRLPTFTFHLSCSGMKFLYS